MSNANATVERMRARQQSLLGGGAAPPPAPPQPTTASQSPAPKKGKDKRPKFPEFRLPHGSAFEARYDRDRQEWFVVLTVPGQQARTTTAGSVHKALIQLGRRWYDDCGREAGACEKAPENVS
jgi:hypothetical protein